MQGPPLPPAPPQFSPCSRNPDGSSKVTATVGNHPELKTGPSVVQSPRSRPGRDLPPPDVHWMTSDEDGLLFVPVSRHHVQLGLAGLLSSPPLPASDFNGF